MTTTMNLLADMYDEAANYIEQHGWHQGRLYPGSGDWASLTSVKSAIARNHPPVCAMGAAYGAQMNPRFDTLSIIDDYHDVLKAEIGGLYVANWNDAPGRTKEQVIDLLRMTALKIRMGNIGDNPREYEFEPMPASEPVTEPAAPQPVKEPQPA